MYIIAWGAFSKQNISLGHVQLLQPLWDRISLIPYGISLKLLVIGQLWLALLYDY